MWALMLQLTSSSRMRSSYRQIYRQPSRRLKRARKGFKGKSVGESETEAVKLAQSARYALTHAIISRKMETSCIMDVFIFPGKPS